MPVRLSDLLSKFPNSPTIGEVIEHPEKYPEEVEDLRSAAQQIADALNAQMRRLEAPISGQFAASLRESMSKLTAFPLEAELRPLMERLLRPLSAADFLDILYPPGTITRDLYEAREHRDIGAIQRLAKRVKWRPQAPEARKELRRRMAERGEEAYVEVFCSAFWQALGHMKTPQQIRFGSEYIKDDSGRPVPMRPYHDLPLVFFNRWLRKETVNFMEDILLDTDHLRSWYDDDKEPLSIGLNPEKWARMKARKAGKRAPLDLGNLASEPISPEEALLLAEMELERKMMLEQIFSVCSPQERTLLKHLADGCTLAEAARAMGIKEATARVMWKRIREKVKIREKIM